MFRVHVVSLNLITFIVSIEKEVSLVALAKFMYSIKILLYRVFQKFVPIGNCILRKAFNASLGKSKLIQVRNLSE